MKSIFHKSIFISVFAFIFIASIGSTAMAAPVSEADNVSFNVSYSTHVQNFGWQADVFDGTLSGTQGQGLRLEGIKIISGIANLGIRYATHVENIGWQEEVEDGAMSGSQGKGLRLEAITITLTGPEADLYDVVYRVHAQNFGWLGWAANGLEAGTAGYGYRLEGIEIKIVEKGSFEDTLGNAFYDANTAIDEPVEESDPEDQKDENKINLLIGDTQLTATLVDNSSTAALKELLLQGPLTIDMRDYGSMEKVGSIGTNLPQNNEQITTEAGDLILYQGNALVIYYNPNSWNFTRLGKIDNLSREELIQILGTGNVQVTLSL